MQNVIYLKYDEEFIKKTDVIPNKRLFTIVENFALNFIDNLANTHSIIESLSISRNLFNSEIKIYEEELFSEFYLNFILQINFNKNSSHGNCNLL